MTERTIHRARPLTKGRIVGLLVILLALFFMASFALKSAELSRLRAWRAQLVEEIAELERQKQALELEKQRRESFAWVDQALRQTGRVPAGVILVTVSTPAAPLAPQNLSTPSAEPAVRGAPIPLGGEEGFFHNANWAAWLRLIRQRE
ncbi:MAG: hypothetical protein H5T71_03025 [Chloroflexi bacterium]|nr:hypothetical protein [Chloroflexota bacterium]